MDIINRAVDIITDPARKLSKRVAYAFCICIIVLAIDWMFKLSDSFITAGKLEQIEKIETLINNDKIDSNVKKHLKVIENDVIQRKTPWNFLTGLYSSLKESLIINSQSAKAVPIERSLLWHTITSGWFLIILAIVLPFAFIGNKSFDSSSIIGFVTVEIFTILFIYLFSYLFSLFPVFAGRPVINYIVNFMLHGLVIGIIGWIGVSVDKAKEKKK